MFVIVRLTLRDNHMQLIGGSFEDLSKAKAYMYDVEEEDGVV